MFIIGQGCSLIINANLVDSGQVIDFSTGDTHSSLVIGQVVDGFTAGGDPDTGVQGTDPTIAAGAENLLQAGRHLREQLEVQMLEAFAGDLRSDAESMKILRDLRAYFLQSRMAIIARLCGHQDPPPPSANDARMASFTIFPTLAPYDVA